MGRHLKSSLWLLALTVLLCSVLYPLVLWAYGQALFPHEAEGSLVNEKGEPVTDVDQARGSRLIGQTFKGDEYFQPRPSSAGGGYDASASGASNWGASNPLLRSRVARQLGPIVTYRDGKRVGPEVQDWFVEADDRLAQWAAAYPGLAANWVNQDDASKAYVKQWSESHAEAPEYRKWRKDNPDKTAPEPGDLAEPFFKSFAREKPRTWLTLDDKDDKGKPLVDRDGKAYKRVTLVKVSKVKKESDENSEVQGYLFDFWLQKHPAKGARLEPVPADMVMSSGSGLDPHITQANARWQLRHRIAGKRAQLLLEKDPGVARLLEAAKKEPDEARRDTLANAIEKAKAGVRKKIEARLGKSLEERVTEIAEDILKDKEEAPFGGLAGVPLVNVLAVNVALDAGMEKVAEKIK
jgi:K+-transporting ATPase ATPase C chain